MLPQIDLTSILEALATLIAQKMQREPAMYNSATQWPPGSKSARHARTQIRAVPGAYRVGRAWVCSTADFEEHHQKRTATRGDDAYTQASRGAR